MSPVLPPKEISVKPALLSATPIRRIPASSRQNFAALAFAAIAVTIAACSGNGTTPSSSSSLLPTVKSNHTATPPPYTYTFQPVDNTLGGQDSRVTAINEKASTVLGLNGTTPNTYDSWSAHTPLPSSTSFREFRTKDYPGAGGTYMAAMTSDFYQAGTVFAPPPSGGLACTACGVIHFNKGSGINYGSGCGSSACEWTFFADPNEGAGNCAATNVLGMSGRNVVVGYYLQGSNSCGTQAFEGYFDTSGAEYFADFDVPGADPNTTQATGVNEEGNAVGTASFKGRPQGWFYIDATYCTGLQAPDSSATYPLSINWEDQVAGYYFDNNQHAHGFLLLNPSAMRSKQVWETVDDPAANGYTVVSDINTHHYITGWYQDKYSTLHGFVGTCTSSICTGAGPRGHEGRSAPVGAGKSKGSGPCITSSSLKWRKRL
jgi:hypothetical protein